MRRQSFTLTVKQATDDHQRELDLVSRYGARGVRSSVNTHLDHDAKASTRASRAGLDCDVPSTTAQRDTTGTLRVRARPTADREHVVHTFDGRPTEAEPTNEDLP